MQNREQLVSDDFKSASQMGSNKDSGQSANPELKQRMEQLRLQREIVGVLITSFVWKLLDSQMILPKSVLNISSDRRSIFLKEEDYFFRTFFGDVSAVVATRPHRSWYNLLLFTAVKRVQRVTPSACLQPTEGEETR